MFREHEPLNISARRWAAKCTVGPTERADPPWLVEGQCAMLASPLRASSIRRSPRPIRSTSVRSRSSSFAAGTPIRLAHVLVAVRREYDKLDRRYPKNESD